MFKKAASFIAVFGMAGVVVGCAITDYGGIPGHTTQSEAKLWGKEIAFLGFGLGFDGTYAYTVKYAPSGAVTINSYQNPGIVSFSRDGLVDRDGDDIQGRGGSAGGRFGKMWVAVDPTSGAPCEFFSNITFDKSTSGFGPGIALCIFGFSEEVDKDLDIQDAFSSLSDLFSQIWSGGLASAFTVQLTSITLNGTTVPLSSAVSVDVTHNGLRPINMAVDLSTPGGQELLQALLANTVDGEPTAVGLGFDGGMSFALPASVTVAVNHDAIAESLK